MIKLEIPRQGDPYLGILDKLTDLALAHQVKVSRRLKEAVLTDGGARFEGNEAILKYLQETEQELHQWWYCAC